MIAARREKRPRIPPPNLKRFLMYKHILVTTDGSANAGLGLEHGIALASSIGAAVTILTVTPPFPIAAAAMGAGAYTPAAVLEGYDQAQRETAERILE